MIAWIGEVGWEACVDAAAGLPATETTLLHVRRRSSRTAAGRSAGTPPPGLDDDDRLRRGGGGAARRGGGRLGPHGAEAIASPSPVAPEES